MSYIFKIRITGYEWPTDPALIDPIICGQFWDCDVSVSILRSQPNPPPPPLLRTDLIHWFGSFIQPHMGWFFCSVNAVDCYCTPLTPLINNYAESRKQRVRAQGRLHGLVITMHIKISFDWDDSYLFLRAVRNKRANLFPTMENRHSVSLFSESISAILWQWTAQSAPCCVNAATD
jgi:hypothetical protein